MRWHEVAALLAASVGAVLVPALWALACFVRRASAPIRLHALLMVGLALAFGAFHGVGMMSFGLVVAAGCGVVIGAGWTVLTVAFAMAITADVAVPTSKAVGGSDQAAST